MLSATSIRMRLEENLSQEGHFLARYCSWVTPSPGYQQLSSVQAMLGQPVDAACTDAPDTHLVGR